MFYNKCVKHLLEMVKIGHEKCSINNNNKKNFMRLTIYFKPKFVFFVCQNEKKKKTLKIAQGHRDCSKCSLLLFVIIFFFCVKLFKIKINCFIYNWTLSWSPTHFAYWHTDFNNDKHTQVTLFNLPAQKWFEPWPISNLISIHIE